MPTDTPPTPLLSYNFDMAHLQDADYAQLYQSRRRDSTFACVYETPGAYIALRDHLGIVPVYYRQRDDEWAFSLTLSDLVRPDDDLDPVGLRMYLATGSTKVHPPIAGIKLVPPGCVIRIDKQTGQITVLYRYTWQPKSTPTAFRLKSLVEQLEFYFLQAIRRLIDHDRVGLFLSGGIDSALIGLTLREHSVEIDAYTSAPWGQGSSDVPFSRINAETIGVTSHHIDYLEPEDYQPTLEQVAAAYPSLHGTPTSLSISRLWPHMGHHEQVFFGQNLDTLTASVRLQSLLYVANWIPAPVRRAIGEQTGSLPDQYSHYRSQGLLGEDDLNQTVLADMPWQQYNNLQQITLLGMLFAYTPADSDVVTQIGFARDCRVSNPYYDVDFIEFNMGVPLAYRLGLSRRRPYLTLTKRLHRLLAQDVLPSELVERKKALTVSFRRGDITQTLAAQFPRHVAGLTLTDSTQRFSAEILRRWGTLHRLQAIQSAFTNPAKTVE